MNPHCTRLRAARTAGSGTRERFSSVHSYSSLLWPSLLGLLLSGLLLNTSCRSVQSSVEALVTGEPPSDPTYAGRQHFPVTPREAVEGLIDIAPHEGWQVISTGEEYSIHGIQGMFFRLEPVAADRRETRSERRLLRRTNRLLCARE